jgi:hypothetical protein
MKRFLGLALTIGVLVGCSHGEESECTRYVSLLSGDNPRVVLDSIGEKKCQDAVDEFKKIFDPRQGEYNKEILLTLAQMWDPDPAEFKGEAEKFAKKKPMYVELLRVALQSPDTAPLAAKLGAEWGLQELRSDFNKLIVDDVKNEQPQYMLAYAPVLSALSAESMGGFSSEMEDVYVTLLNNSPDIQTIEVNKLAAKALGAIKSTNPEAVKAMVKALFLQSKDGGTTFKEAVQSLLQMGPVVVPYLVDILNSNPGDENVRYIEEYAVKNAISDWKWRRGMRIPMVLAQLRDPRAGGALVEDMGRAVIEPANLPDNLKQDWTITQTNRLKFDSWGLMSALRAPHSERAVALVRDKNVEGSARLQLALAMAFSFTPEMTAGLFKVVYEPAQDEGGEEETGEAGAQAASAVKMPPPARESDFVIRFLQTIAYAVDADSLPTFNDVFISGFDENFGDVEKAEYIQDKLEAVDIKILLKVVEACQKDYACYRSVFMGSTGKAQGSEVAYDPEAFKGADPRETEYLKAMGRSKAGLVLSRWKLTAELRAELTKTFIDVYSALSYDDELYGDLRQVILLGLERFGMNDPKKVVMTALKDLLEKEGKKGSEGMDVRNQRLEALISFLEHYDPTVEKQVAGVKEEKKAESAAAAPAAEKPAEAPKEEAAPAEEE